MSRPGLSDPSAPQISVRRRAVLTRLREAAGPVAAEEIAEAAGLHANTARFHLDALVEDGLADRAPEKRSTPGRPRVMYAARFEASDQRSYGLLSEMLTGMVAGFAGAHDVAVDAGRAWGRSLAEPGEPLTELVRVFTEIGFDPKVQPDDGTGTDIHLRHCPFVEVAARHPEVVCGLHQGLMEGLLGELGDHLTAERLEPFVAPRLCIARVRAAATSPAAPGRSAQPRLTS
jgi:predicted ArsR family transcriptional regulator